MGEPSAVLLLSCSPDTMSSRARCRGTSSSGLHPGSDRDDATHRTAKSFCDHSQEVADHYQHKKLLHTIDAERSPDDVFAQICQAMDSSSTF
nr:PREDICTED: adenylate kinase isoenzyme 5-like [Paralichthys olivaceus]